MIGSAWYGRINIVQELLDNEANVHAQDDEALLNAANNAHSSIVRILLNHRPGEAGITTLSPELQREYQHLKPGTLSIQEYYQSESTIEKIREITNGYILGIKNRSYVLRKV